MSIVRGSVASRFSTFNFTPEALLFRQRRRWDDDDGMHFLFARRAHEGMSNHNRLPRRQHLPNGFDSFHGFAPFVVFAACEPSNYTAGPPKPLET